MGKDFIESDQWQTWLAENGKFKFESGWSDKFTAYKSKKDIWTAQRRVNGRLRHQYLGKNQELTYERLLATAQKLALNDSNYEREVKPTLRKVDKELLAELRPEKSALTQSHKSSGEYETVTETSSQAQEEIAKLKAENEHLENQLDELRQLKEVLKSAKRYRLHGKEVIQVEAFEALNLVHKSVES
jgi:predicted RNase H-like nuclease (RuvC/YqgF family)